MSGPKVWPPNHEELERMHRDTTNGIAVFVVVFFIVIVCIELFT